MHKTCSKIIIRLLSPAFVLLLFSSSEIIAAESLYFIHQDHLGSKILVTDESGKIVEKQVYFPFGETRQSANLQLTNNNSKPITERQYTGQVSDQDETGLYYYNARYYNPQIAKFTQADNALDGLNRYAYVGNNPIIMVDTSGEIAYIPDRVIPPPPFWQRPELFGRVSISDTELARIALSVFAETNNATAPKDIMEIISWIFINRYMNPETSIYDKGFGILIGVWKKQMDPYYKELYLKPGMSNEALADKALEVCYMNSELCPKMSQKFDEALKIVKSVYYSYALGAKDPTRGSIYFAHDDKLERINPKDNSVVKFKNIEQVHLWQRVNIQYQKSVDPNFIGGVSNIYLQQWGELKPEKTFLVYGNHPCVWSGTCGYDRPYANRPDLLLGRYGILKFLSFE